MPELSSRKIISHQLSRPVIVFNSGRSQRTSELPHISGLRYYLIGVAQRLYKSEKPAVDLVESLYALDSTTVDLCLSLFP